MFMRKVNNLYEMGYDYKIIGSSIVFTLDNYYHVSMKINDFMKAKPDFIKEYLKVEMLNWVDEEQLNNLLNINLYMRKNKR
jgi:hypothetical protein